MELKEITSKLEDYTAADIVKFLCEKNMSFEVFSSSVIKHGGWDSAEKRKNVKAILNQMDAEAYNAAVVSNSAEAILK